MISAPNVPHEPAEQTVLSFVDAVRRRAFARLLLRGALFAALVNETARWLAVGAIALAGWEIPVVDLGPLFLLAVVPFAWRRMSREASAALADAALGFRDRLLSFLDFRRRADLPAAVRAAQAAEVATALAGSRPSAAVPIRARSYAGPLLLAASLAYPLLFLAAPDTTTVRVVQRMTPGGGGIRPGLGLKIVLLPPPPPPGKPAQTPPDAGQKKAEEKPPETSGGGKGPAAEAGGETAGTQPPPSRRPPPERKEEQESQIASQRVGAELSKVVDPVYNPASRDGAADRETPAGSLAFHLLPKASKRGASPADSSVEQVAPERVVVDFDALPERYRPLVKAYFLLLSQRND
jgi:hypothetical protein